jgi:ATP-dependent exoDNAse (exonuclease V) beta subunit
MSRSACRSILNYVNGRFKRPLSGVGQLGFTALETFHDDHHDGLCVAAHDVRAANAERKASADEQRNAEADAAARLCASLIGDMQVADGSLGDRRPLRAGDITLLAPTGTDMWRYDEALERHGIAVATQAGKALYRRREVQELIALTRALADGRDSLALGGCSAVRS